MSDDDDNDVVIVVVLTETEKDTQLETVNTTGHFISFEFEGSHKTLL